MATEVVMPQMGESIAEGTITKWLVQVGETVERDQPLFEISTDKVDAEIPSPEAGVLLEIKHEEGETVAVDEVVAVIGEEGEEPEDADEKAAPEAEEVEEEAPEESPQESEEEPEPEEQDEAEEEPAGEDDEAEDQEAEDEETEERAAKADEDEGDGDEALKERLKTHSSPVVRKMAEEHDVDISELEGTGIHGRVTKADLERHLAEREEEPAEKPAPKKPAPKKPAPKKPAPKKPAPKKEAKKVEEKKAEPAGKEVSGVPARAGSVPSQREAQEFHVPAYREGDNVEIEPMSKIRQITAAHMAYSKNTSAHVTTCFHMDMSRVHKIRERAKRGFHEAQGTKLTYMPFIFRAVANALKTNRKVNASIDGTDIVYKKDINLGMAVALDWGLIVPVLRNADQLSLVGLAKQANDLAERARSKKLSPDEVQGGTFTITNPGVFGSLWGTPIINQPQVAILGIGVIEKRPIVDTDAEGNDTITIKTMAYFSITYDHRLVDGADADEFMNDVKHTLESETWNELDPYM